jgi:MATE family multidrug resistance protein
MFLVINTYISCCKELQEAWIMPDWSTIRGINDYLKLGIPSSAMLCLEWWSFEIMILIAGYISIKASATAIIVYNTNTIFLMFPSGLSTATAALVGKSLGAGDVKQSKRYAKLTSIINLI